MNTRAAYKAKNKKKKYILNLITLKDKQFRKSLLESNAFWYFLTEYKMPDTTVTFFFLKNIINFYILEL